jgi:hypothetical protein
VKLVVEREGAPGREVIVGYVVMSFLVNIRCSGSGIVTTSIDQACENNHRFAWYY